MVGVVRRFLFERGSSVKVCLKCLSIFDDAVRFCPYHGAELRPFVGRTYEAGESVCGYYLQKKIGCDGLGVIYRATKGANTYRLRIYSDALLLESERVSRLCELLESDTKMSGGAIPVADFDRTESGGLYSAHPYIPGYSMRDIIERGEVLRESDVSEVLLLLLRAVRDIHSQEKVHGNIALSNIILDGSGRIRIHDAGLWDVVRGEQFESIRDDHPSFFGDVLELMSPEVARGDRPLVCSDVFSCGAAACYLLGLAPLNRDPIQIVNERIDGITFTLRSEEARKVVSDDFADLLEASTFGTPGVRFQATRAFITALLSVHPSLDEDLDALDGELCDRLLKGAERVSSFFDLKAIESDKAQKAVVEDGMRALQVSEHRIEKTIRGVDSDRTVVERTQFDGLSHLIGEALEQTAVTDIMERAVTTEMDPVDATPTVEMKKADSSKSLSPVDDLSSALDRELFDIFNQAQKSSSQHDRSLLGGEKIDFDSLISDPFADEKSEDGHEKAADLFKDFEVLTRDDKAPSEKSKDASKDISEAEKSEAEKSEADDSDAKREIVAGSDSQVAKETAKDGDRSEGDEKSEAIQKAEAAEHAFEADEAAFAERGERGKQPHKRIGKRDNGEKSDRSDVVSMSESKETMRVRRRRRRSPEDCQPRNDVVEADTSIHATAERKNLPPFSKLPVLTATNGYAFDEADEDDDVDMEQAAFDLSEMDADEGQEAASSDGASDGSSGEEGDSEVQEAGAESAQDDEGNVFDDVGDDFDDVDDEAQEAGAGWFGNEGEEAPVADRGKSGKRWMRVALLIALVLVVICVVVGVAKFGSQGIGDPEADDAEASQAKLAEFEKLLADPTKENRVVATAMLVELRDANLGQKTMQKCRENYVQAFESEAKKIRGTLKKSVDASNPLDMKAGIGEIDSDYLNCIGAIAEGDVERESKETACVATQTKAKEELKRQSESAALALEPEYEKERAGWTELEGIYRDILAQRRGGGNNFAAELDEASGEIQAYDGLLEALVALKGTQEGVDLMVEGSQAAMGNVAPNHEQVPDAEAMSNGLGVAAATEQGNVEAQAQAEADAEAQRLAEARRAEAEADAEAQRLAEAQAQAEAQRLAEAQNQAEADAEAQRLAEARRAEAQRQAEAQKQAESQQRAEAMRQAREQRLAEEQRIAKEREEAQRQAKAQRQAQAQQQAAAAKPTERRVAEKPAAAPTPTPAPAAAAAGGQVPTAKLIADANAAMNKKDFAGAVKLLETAIKQDPRNGRAHFTLAKANERLGKLALAAQNAKTACDLLKAASCYKYLGDLYKRTGQDAEAAEAYSKAK